jgi:hypothetical protein
MDYDLGAMHSEAVRKIPTSPWRFNGEKGGGNL